MTNFLGYSFLILVCIISASFVVFGESNGRVNKQESDLCTFVERNMPMKNKHASCFMCVKSGKVKEDLKTHCVFNEILTPPYLTCQPNIKPAEGSSFNETDCQTRYNQTTVVATTQDEVTDILVSYLLLLGDVFMAKWKPTGPGTTENGFLKEEGKELPVAVMDKSLPEPINDQKLKSINDRLDGVDHKFKSINDRFDGIDLKLDKLIKNIGKYSHCNNQNTESCTKSTEY